MSTHPFFPHRPIHSMIATVTVIILLVFLLLRLNSILHLLCRLVLRLNDLVHPYQTFVIPRHDDVTSLPNPFYLKSLAYVSSLSSLPDSDGPRILSTGRRSHDFYLQHSPTHTLTDHFRGARMQWTRHGGSSLELRLRRCDHHSVLRPYLRHVESVANEIESRRKEVKLFVANCRTNCWMSIPSMHLMTMDTIVMDSELKSRVKSDLENFSKGKNYYSRIGKVWKRSYLLHGPPGTGKSTFVAAMAKFLNYDVYDLDLPKIAGGSDVKTLLLQTTPKSVILVEDFDRFGPEISNLTNGVFSCWGEERIFVFTMSGEMKESIATSRFDVQVYFPLCDFVGFKSMASGYLGLEDHKLFAQVGGGFERRRGELSHAEIGEIMIGNQGSPSRAMKSVIRKLNRGFKDGNAWGLEVDQVNVGSVGRSPVRAIKKLYGLLRRSWSKKEGTMSVKMAAAAAKGNCGFEWKN